MKKVTLAIREDMQEPMPVYVDGVCVATLSQYSPCIELDEADADKVLSGQAYAGIFSVVAEREETKPSVMVKTRTVRRG